MRRLRSKRVVISALLVFGGLTLLASAQSWVTFGFDPAASAIASVTVSGNQIAPLAFALALTALAGTAALTIAGKTLNTVISVAIALCSAGVIVAAMLVVASPVASAQAQLTAATGISGKDSLADYVASQRMEAWLFVTVMASILLLAVALVATFTSQSWHQGGARFNTHDPEHKATPSESIPTATETRDLALADDRILDWDALSHGRDPSAQDPL